LIFTYHLNFRFIDPQAPIWRTALLPGHCSNSVSSSVESLTSSTSK